MGIKQTPRLDSKWINSEAYQIVHDLQKRGFVSYLVGGCVRDLLLGKQPKDFDIATNATPRDVKRAVRNCYIIGKRFRLVLAKRGEAQFEVATFRRDPLPDENREELPEGDNLFGSPEDDAKRRDFTINALFYDPVANELIDHAKGLKDLKSGVVRMIGDPNVRLIEDPIRIMRGIRLSHMIRFRMESQLKKAISTHAAALSKTALPRRREEFLKYLRLEDPSQAFITSLDLGVLEYISPTLVELFKKSDAAEEFLKSLSQISDHHPVSPTELFSHFLLAYVRLKISPDPDRELRAHELLKNKDLTRLMRDELGMFKSEQAIFTKALQIEPLLKQKKVFEKRGPRRQLAVLTSDAFPLALQLAERELMLKPEDLHYWKSAHVELSNREKSGDFKGKRKRRPRKKRS